MRAIAPKVHPDVPVHVFAENQAEYKPLSVAIFRDGEESPYPGVYRLVTAYKPSSEEHAQMLATMMEACEGRVQTGVLRRILDALFEKHPVVVELLSGDGRLTPQNVYAGVPAWMRGKA